MFGHRKAYFEHSPPNQKWIADAQPQRPSLTCELVLWECCCKQQEVEKERDTPDDLQRQYDAVEYDKPCCDVLMNIISKLLFAAAMHTRFWTTARAQQVRLTKYSSS